MVVSASLLCVSSSSLPPVHILFHLSLSGFSRPAGERPVLASDREELSGTSGRAGEVLSNVLASCKRSLEKVEGGMGFLLDLCKQCVCVGVVREDPWNTAQRVLAGLPSLCWLPLRSQVVWELKAAASR